DLSPPLPVAGRDEVGTLTRAFADMTGRLSEMMREIRVSRQLAAIGEFSAQLSHEIRNPLTSLKLELQGMQRQLRKGNLPDSFREPVDQSLHEVSRLDTVARGVLALARPTTPRRERIAVQTCVDDALTALRAELDERRIIVDRAIEDRLPDISADAELVSGML